ncbi:hypothetical protein [Desulfocurvus sp.]|uniref:hypothetical protein n=1 Tax=Desulfocurvus sp. TaxID=2871698 RepID=UPI0025BA2E00|nr:hypothetical protein [Desulfocurvus sp.]MCK9240871.1 hypothetical protein [Desulfocurvus sp.]
MFQRPYTMLHDDQGQPVGVFISAALWAEVQAEVLPVLQRGAGEPDQVPEEAFPEPLGDWGDLLAYWDLPYPLDRAVTCGHCGAHSADWQADEPRLFRLKACNIGGLASFECQGCRARVTKRHFKDGVKVQTVPFAE